MPSPVGVRAAHGGVWAGAGSISLSATILGLGSLAAIIVLRKTVPRVPGAIVALLGGTAVAAIFGLDVDTIGSRFGGIPGGLPTPHFPAFEAALIPALIRPAVTVAMLGAIESLMSAVVADRMGSDRHNPNMELIGQGVANIASPIFGGLPATGAIARTATNIRLVRGTVAGIITPSRARSLLARRRWGLHPWRARRHHLRRPYKGEWHEIPQMLSDQDGHQRGSCRRATVSPTDTRGRSRESCGAAIHPRVSTTRTVSMVTSAYIEPGGRQPQDTTIPPYSPLPDPRSLLFAPP